MMIDRGRISNTQNEVQTIENITNNPLGFLKTLQNKVYSFHKLQDRVWVTEFFQIKRR